MDYFVRPITLGDEPLLWEMLYQAIYVNSGAEPPPREVVLQPEIRRYLQDWGQLHDFGFVAVYRATGESIGAAWCRLLGGNQKGYGYVDDATPELTVAVEPKYRGQGVGTRLVAQLIATAQSRYAFLSLSVSPDNPALRLYLRQGFETVGTCGGSLVMKCSMDRLPDSSSSAKNAARDGFS